METDSLSFTHFTWFRQLLLDNFGQIEIRDSSMTPTEFVTGYMFWAVNRGFLHTFGNPSPVAGILFRRVNQSQIDRIEEEYHKTLFEFDTTGDTLWIDFMHAPGNYPFMVDFISKLGVPKIAFCHAKRDHYKLFEVSQLHRLTPMFNGKEQASPLMPLVIDQLKVRR